MIPIGDYASDITEVELTAKISEIKAASRPLGAGDPPTDSGVEDSSWTPSVNDPLLQLMGEQLRAAPQKVEAVAKQCLLRQLIVMLQNGALDKDKSFGIPQSLLDSAESFLSSDIAKASDGAAIERWVEENYQAIEPPASLYSTTYIERGGEEDSDYEHVEEVSEAEYQLNPDGVSKPLAMQIFTALAKNFGPVWDSRERQIDDLDLTTLNDVDDYWKKPMAKAQNTRFALIGLPDNKLIGLVFTDPNWFFVDPKGQMAGEGWTAGRYQLKGETEEDQREKILESLSDAAAINGSWDEVPITLLMNQAMAPELKQSLREAVVSQRATLRNVPELSSEEKQALAVFGKILGLPIEQRKERLFNAPNLLEMNQPLLEKALEEIPAERRAIARSNVKAAFKKTKPVKDKADELLYLQMAALPEPEDRIALLKRSGRVRLNEEALAAAEQFINKVVNLPENVNITDFYNRQHDRLRRQVAALADHGVILPAVGGIAIMAALAKFQRENIEQAFEAVPRETLSEAQEMTVYRDLIKSDEAIREEYLLKQPNLIELDSRVFDKLIAAEIVGRQSPEQSGKWSNALKKQKAIIEKTFAAVAERKRAEAVNLYRRIVDPNITLEQAADLLKAQKTWRIHRGALGEFNLLEEKHRILDAFIKVSPSEVAHEYLYEILLSSEANPVALQNRMTSDPNLWGVNEKTLVKFKEEDQTRIRKIFQGVENYRDEEDHQVYGQILLDFDVRRGVQTLRRERMTSINQRVFARFSSDEQAKLLSVFKQALLETIKPATEGEPVRLENSDWVQEQLDALEAQIPKEIVGELAQGPLLGQGADGRVFVATDANGQRFVVKEFKNAQALREEAENYEKIKGRHPNIVRSFGRRTMMIDGRVTEVMVLEHVDGTSAFRVIENLTINLQAGVISQQDFVLAVDHLIVSALRAAQFCATQENLMHGDIKLGNIVIDKDGRPVLVDFGRSQTRGLPDWIRRSAGGVDFQIHGPDQTGVLYMLSDINALLRANFSKYGISQAQFPLANFYRQPLIERYGQTIKQLMGAAWNPLTAEGALVNMGVAPEFTTVDLKRAIALGARILSPDRFQALSQEWLNYTYESAMWITWQQILELPQKAFSVEELIKSLWPADPNLEAEMHGEDDLIKEDWPGDPARRMSLRDPAYKDSLFANPLRVYSQAPGVKEQTRAKLDFLLDPPGAEGRGAQVLAQTVVRYKNQVSQAKPAGPAPFVAPDVSKLEDEKKDALYSTINRARFLLDIPGEPDWDQRVAGDLLRQANQFSYSPSLSADLRTLSISQLERLEKDPSLLANLQELAAIAPIEDKIYARRALKSLIDGHRQVSEAFRGDTPVSLLRDLSWQPQTEEVKKLQNDLLARFPNVVSIFHRLHAWSSSPEMAPVIALLDRVDSLKALHADASREYRYLQHKSDPALAALMTTLANKQKEIQDFLSGRAQSELSADEWVSFKQDVEQRIADFDKEYENTKIQLADLAKREKVEKCNSIGGWLDNQLEKLEGVVAALTTLNTLQIRNDPDLSRLRSQMSAFLDQTADIRDVKALGAKASDATVVRATWRLAPAEQQMAQFEQALEALRQKEQGAAQRQSALANAFASELSWIERCQSQMTEYEEYFDNAAKKAEVAALLEMAGQAMAQWRNRMSSPQLENDVVNAELVLATHQQNNASLMREVLTLISEASARRQLETEAKLANVMERAEKLESAVADLQAENDMLKGDIASLRGDLVTGQIATDERMRRLEGMVESLAAQNGQLRDRQQEMERRTEDLETKTTTLRDDVDWQQGQQTVAGRKVDELSATVAALGRTTDKLITDEADLTARVNGLSSDAIAARNIRAGLTNQIGVLTPRVDNLRQEVDQMPISNQNRDGRIQNLEDQMADMTRDLTDLGGRVHQHVWDLPYSRTASHKIRLNVGVPLVNLAQSKVRYFRPNFPQADVPGIQQALQALGLSANMVTSEAGQYERVRGRPIYANPHTGDLYVYLAGRNAQHPKVMRVPQHRHGETAAAAQAKVNAVRNRPLGDAHSMVDFEACPNGAHHHGH